ncbi:MAG: PTS transporter subunit EIIC [Actinomycetota bacterium]|jgi:PTS system N-acetylglucosamine-specific IIC component|nr:PTS transporter subunit EIIC [Actinomycetota bacterium]
MLGTLQRIGRALMMPIAVLPAAALLLRLGEYFGTVSWLSWGTPLWDVMEAGGGAVFSNLPLLFAIGVAIGFTEGAGAAGLAAGVGYIILKAINDASPLGENVLNAQGEPATVDMGVLGGILIGLLAAGLYRRYADIRLPDYLAFFGGRRYVPIVTAFAAIGVGLVARYLWPAVGGGIDAAGNWIVATGALGAFVYGVANRALVPFGLHHILNALVWFQFGTFTNPDTGEQVTGDLNRFFAGDPEAGIFMAGWYFVMMFGLPAAAYAMYRQANRDERKATGAVMGSSGFTSFLTGITEPIEFSFLFLAPALYAIHALLSGSALVVADLLGIKHGFGFSAGLIDYLVSLPQATNPLLIWPVGLVYGVIYFGLFTVAIRALDLATPGREPRRQAEEATAPTARPAQA